MSLRTWIASRVMDRLTGLDHERKVRADVERARAGGPHVIEYFHQVDDPYSHLAVQALAKIESRYDVLRLRYVLPMVMRGLPVPRMKGLCFSRDSAREAWLFIVSHGRTRG